MIELRKIDFVISQDWRVFQTVDFDKETSEFVENYIKNHYDKIHQGLLDENTPKETNVKGKI